MAPDTKCGLAAGASRGIILTMEYFAACTDRRLKLLSIVFVVCLAAVSRDQQVSCDGSTPIRGTRATMRVYGLFGDSASVAWSTTCSLAKTGESEPRVSGSGGTYELLRAGDSWVVKAAGLRFDF